MLLDCRRKSEHLKETHTDTRRACKLHSKISCCQSGDRTRDLLIVKQHHCTTMLPNNRICILFVQPECYDYIYQATRGQQKLSPLGYWVILMIQLFKQRLIDFSQLRRYNSQTTDMFFQLTLLIKRNTAVRDTESCGAVFHFKWYLS